MSQAIRINWLFGWGRITKRSKGSRQFIYAGLSLACGSHPVMGALGLFAYASDPVVTNDAG
jgi:hypothetical protein